MNNLNNLVKASKIEAFYFKREDLKALFELYYKLNNIHIGEDWEWSGLHIFDIPSNNNYPSRSDDYTRWHDRLDDMYNDDAIPAGKYLIESDYYCDGSG